MLHLTHVNKLARRPLARPDEVRVADLGQLVFLACRVEEFAVEGAAPAGKDSLLEQHRVLGLQLHVVEVQPGTFSGGRTISAASQEGGAEGQPDGGTEAVGGLAGRLLAGLHPPAQRVRARLDVRTAYPQRDFCIRLFGIGFFRRYCCRHWFDWLFCQQGLLGSTLATAGTVFRHLRIQLPVVATQVGDVVHMKLGLAQKGRETLGAGALPQILDAELPA